MSGKIEKIWTKFIFLLTLSRPNGPIWGHSPKNKFSRLVSGIFDLDSKQLANGPKCGHSFLNLDSKQPSNGPKWGHCSKNSKNRLRANYPWVRDMKQIEMVGFRLIKFSGKTALCAQSYTRSRATTFRLLQQKHSCFGCCQPSWSVPNSMWNGILCFASKKSVCVHWSSIGHRDAFGVFGKGFWRTQITGGARFLVD